MIVLPHNPAEQRSPAALRDFLNECREAARRDRHAKLVSISITVDALDPLAVLEAIYEPGHPHFYMERPVQQAALAGAESAVALRTSGPARFTATQAWVDEVLEHTIAVGTIDAPFGGPHVFTGFTFCEVQDPAGPFAPAQAFVPRWQVARHGDTTTAVANLLVEAEADLDGLTERVWRAHAKFHGFTFGDAAELPRRRRPRLQVSGNGNGAAYRAMVESALRRIEAGQLEKVVLARALDVEADAPLHPLGLLNGLRQRFPDCYAFSVANGAGTSFIGASPERLVRVSGGVLETDALAGTARRGEGAAEDAVLGAGLLRSEKDRREQRLVLDSIHRRLEPLGLTLRHPPDPVLLRLANVQHLHTPVRAELPPGIRILDALARLHPTPAVGGSPREPALALIAELEDFPRGAYAGAHGWINARGDGEFLVGIRSALVSGNNARLYAGAGIVAGSDPAREETETELKFRALLDALLQSQAHPE